jgi:hypothetical protein
MRITNLTRRRDLERLIAFLTQLHLALRSLFDNGRRPTLTPIPWSSRALIRRKVGDRRKFTAHEAIVIDTKECLRLITEAATARRRRQHGRTARRPRS